MKKDPLIFLGHILESIELIEKYSKKLTKAKFLKNCPMQDAIIRRLEIVGEAVKNLPTSFKARYPGIPWKQMAGMRDILIHQYSTVDLPLTWKVVKEQLPPLKRKILAALKQQNML